MTDSLIGDRYVLGPLIGRGGMAEVRRARDTRLERDVAIKRLKADLAGDPVFQERFRREAHSAAGLNHPNIVSVFDTGQALDEASGLMIPYIVMELVVGHTLREILHDGRKLQPNKALELTQSVLEALDYSHRHGIIHRDIKPANIMLTTTGQVKVMDFGIARAVSDTAASMTQTASVIGTPQYLSPEQIRGDTVDRRSDIYATGCLLYELLTGKPPFEGDSPVSLAYQHVRATPVPPSEIDPLVTPDMDAVVLKSLAKSPADRYQTAHDMAQDIARLLTGQKVEAIAPPPVPDDAATQVLAGADRTQVMPSAGTTTPARAVIPEEPTSHLGRIIGIVLGVMLLIALGAVGVVYAANHAGNNPVQPTESNSGLVMVPAVTTMNQANAVQTLQDRNLKATIQPVHGAADTTLNTVTQQNPRDGTMVPPGTAVILTVNIGPEKFLMPDVIGHASAVAVSEVTKVFPNTSLAQAPNGVEKCTDVVDTILKTDPVPGADVPKDTAVTLYYATGNVTLPNLRGETEIRAAAILGNLCIAGANIEIVDRQSSDPSGYVVDQSPEYGTVVSKDSKVILTVTVPMPPPPPPTSTPPTEPPTPPTTPPTSEPPTTEPTGPSEPVTPPTTPTATHT